MFGQQISCMLVLAGILAQLHIIDSFTTKMADNVENIAPSLLDLELIEPPADFAPNLEKGNEKIHKIAESYRVTDSDVADEVSLSTSQTDIVTTENSLKDYNVEVKKLLDYFPAKNTSEEAAAGKSNKPDTTELPVAQEKTAENLLSKESNVIKNASTKDPSAKSENGTKSNKLQQNNSFGQILASNVKISNDHSASISKQIMSSEKFQEPIELLAEYFANSKQISFDSSQSVSNEDSNQYVNTLVLPLSYEEPFATGHIADDCEELCLQDFVDLVLPGENINYFHPAFLPKNALNEANSEVYLVFQQPEDIRSVECSSPPEEVIFLYEFEDCV